MKLLADLARPAHFLRYRVNLFVGRLSLANSACAQTNIVGRGWPCFRFPS